MIEQVNDGRRPPKVSIEIEELPTGQKWPEFPTKLEPIGGWIEDVANMNDFLFSAWQS